MTYLTSALPSLRRRMNFWADVQRVSATLYRHRAHDYQASRDASHSTTAHVTLGTVFNDNIDFADGNHRARPLTQWS